MCEVRHAPSRGRRRRRSRVLLVCHRRRGAGCGAGLGAGVGAGLGTLLSTDLLQRYDER